MAFKPKGSAQRVRNTNYETLRSTLNVSKIQQENNPLYQIFGQLIDLLTGNKDFVDSKVNSFDAAHSLTNENLFNLAKIAGPRQITVTLGDGITPIIDLTEIDIPIRFNCIISKCIVVAQPSGDIIIDIQKSSFDDYDTMASIVDLTPPTISGDVKYIDTVLDGWTTQINYGDVLRFIVDGNAVDISRATVVLELFPLFAVNLPPVQTDTHSDVKAHLQVI